jgi:hypothetical protein
VQLSYTSSRLAWLDRYAPSSPLRHRLRRLIGRPCRLPREKTANRLALTLTTRPGADRRAEIRRDRAFEATTGPPRKAAPPAATGGENHLSSAIFSAARHRTEAGNGRAVFKIILIAKKSSGNSFLGRAENPSLAATTHQAIGAIAEIRLIHSREAGKKNSAGSPENTCPAPNFLNFRLTGSACHGRPATGDHAGKAALTPSTCIFGEHQRDRARRRSRVTARAP